LTTSAVRHNTDIIEIGVVAHVPGTPSDCPGCRVSWRYETNLV
jgi:hypothetical protein